MTSRSSRPSKLGRIAFIVKIIVVCGVCAVSTSRSLSVEPSKTDLSARDFLETIARTQQQDEDGGQKRIQAWERVSDASVIDELIDAFDNMLFHGSALSVIVKELKLPDAEKVRLLGSRAKREVNPVKKVAAMGQLLRYGREFPDVIDIWVPALGDLNRFEVPSRLSDGDMRVCDAAFNLIISNLEIRKLLVHHSLAWASAIGDGVPVNEKNRRIDELKRFLVGNGLVVMGVSKPPDSALPTTPAVTPVPPATPAPSLPISTDAESSPPVIEHKSPVWPWVVGILALIVIGTVALKRRA